MEKSSQQQQRETKREFWKEHVRLWQDSGLSQKEYCRQNNLRENRLTYWKKRFTRPGQTVSLVEVKLPSHFSQGHTALRLNLGNAYQIEVGSGFDPVTLKQLIYVLGQA